MQQWMKPNTPVQIWAWPLRSIWMASIPFFLKSQMKEKYACCAPDIVIGRNPPHFLNIFTLTSVWTRSPNFFSYHSNQAIKKHLLDHENRLVHTAWTCEQLLTRKPRHRLLRWKITKKIAFSSEQWAVVRFSREQLFARPCNVRQSILEEMLFYCLVTIVAQELADLLKLKLE